MGNARKFLDLWFDFVVFLAGVTFAFMGFAKAGELYRLSLKGTMQKGAITYLALGTYDDSMSGEEVQAWLMGAGSVSVVFDGTEYEPPRRREVMERISLSKRYRVTRQYLEGVVSAPSVVLLTEEEEGET